MSQLLGSWGLVARAYMVQVWTLRVMIRGEEKPEHSLGGGAGGRHLPLMLRREWQGPGHLLVEEQGFSWGPALEQVLVLPAGLPLRALRPRRWSAAPGREALTGSFTGPPGKGQPP